MVAVLVIAVRAPQGALTAVMAGTGRGAELILAKPTKAQIAEGQIDDYPEQTGASRADSKAITELCRSLKAGRKTGCWRWQSVEVAPSTIGFIDGRKRVSLPQRPLVTSSGGVSTKVDEKKVSVGVGAT